MRLLIITIDDSYRNTIKTLSSENIDIPLVIGVPAGLLGKLLDGYKVADEYDIKELLNCNKNVEIASHGYFHIILKYRQYKVLNHIKHHSKIELYYFKKLCNSPDIIDLIFRSVNTLPTQLKDKMIKFPVKECTIKKHLYLEIILSKNLLEKKFNEKCITYIYPGGYYDENILKYVVSAYLFARSTDPGINTIDIVTEKFLSRYLIKSFGISKYTRFKILERTYEKIIKKVKEGILIVETYHMISKDKVKYLYSTKFEDFKEHIKRLVSGLNFTPITFKELLKNYNIIDRRAANSCKNFTKNIR